MTPTEYWKKEINRASELAPPDNLGAPEDKDPQIVAALIVAGQLQAITTVLSEIRSQLQQIDDSINS